MSAPMHERFRVDPRVLRVSIRRSAGHWVARVQIRNDKGNWLSASRERPEEAIDEVLQQARDCDFPGMNSEDLGWAYPHPQWKEP